MYFLDPLFLGKCEQLKDGGWRIDRHVGSLVGRSFADLGSEVFVLLPGDKIRSLFTGEESKLDEHLASFLFAIPDPDTLVGIIEREGGKVETLELVDGRTWKLRVAFPDQEVLSENATALSHALIDILLSRPKHVEEIRHVLG